MRLGVDDLSQIMDLLDNGTNLFGPLSPEIRRRLWAVVAKPSQESWDDTYSIILSYEKSWLTLWQAVLRFTDYDIDIKQCDHSWQEIPTQQQILDALTCALDDEGDSE